MMINKSDFSVIGAYICWGLFPLYWKQLEQVSSLEILAHRAVWLLALMLLVSLFNRQLKQVITALRDSQATVRLLATCALQALNWGTYIWAVNAGYVLQASLGAFIGPVVSVVLGTVVLKEPLRGYQRYALLACVGGVLYLTVSYQQVPWAALVIAFASSGYALSKRNSTLSVQNGIALEAAVLAVPAMLYLGFLQSRGTIAFGAIDLTTTLFLAGTGMVTAIPLMLFSHGVKRVSFASLGMYQFVAPTLTFLLGVFIYNEGFGSQQLIGFILIWVAAGLYLVETFRCNKCCPILPT